MHGTASMILLCACVMLLNPSLVKTGSSTPSHSSVSIQKYTIPLGQRAEGRARNAESSCPVPWYASGTAISPCIKVGVVREREDDRRRYEAAELISCVKKKTRRWTSHMIESGIKSFPLSHSHQGRGWANTGTKNLFTDRHVFMSKDLIWQMYSSDTICHQISKCVSENNFRGRFSSYVYH